MLELALMGASTVLCLGRDAWSTAKRQRQATNEQPPPPLVRVGLTVGKCEIYKEERDAVEEMRKLDLCDMEEFDRQESSEKTIAILGDRWWPQTAKQDGDRISKQFTRSTWKKRNERPNVGGVSIRSRNGAPSRKGCVINGQITNTSNKRVRPPPPSCHQPFKTHVVNGV